jgi:hypothetical protein
MKNMTHPPIFEPDAITKSHLPNSNPNRILNGIRRSVKNYVRTISENTRFSIQFINKLNKTLSEIIIKCTALEDLQDKTQTRRYNLLPGLTLSQYIFFCKSQHNYNTTFLRDYYSKFPTKSGKTIARQRNKEFLENGAEHLLTGFREIKKKYEMKKDKDITAVQWYPAKLTILKPK